MLHVNQASPDLSSPSLINQLSSMALNDIGLLEVASRLEITTTTVKKILKGQPVSHYVQSKVHAALRNGLNKNTSSKESEIQRLTRVNRLYQENRTLHRVGLKIGLSRERVRQLLSKGAEIGLFTYQPSRPKRPTISKKKLLNDYKKYRTLSRVAKENKISLSYLKQLRDAFYIDNKELAALRAVNQRRECLNAYSAIVKELGYHPTTTELQQKKGGRYLETKIRRLWGSFIAFRQTQKQSPTPLIVRFQLKARFQQMSDHEKSATP